MLELTQIALHRVAGCLLKIAMKIVIAGAGEVGFHLAKLLSFDRKI